MMNVTNDSCMIFFYLFKILLLLFVIYIEKILMNKFSYFIFLPDIFFLFFFFFFLFQIENTYRPPKSLSFSCIYKCRPLKKLHSSVDELKNEFQNFKMIFLHTYNNNNNNNNNNNHDHHRHQHQHQQQHSS